MIAMVRRVLFSKDGRGPACVGIVRIGTFALSKGDLMVGCLHTVPSRHA